MPITTLIIQRSNRQQNQQIFLSVKIVKLCTTNKLRTRNNIFRKFCQRKNLLAQTTHPCLLKAVAGNYYCRASSDKQTLRLDWTVFVTRQISKFYITLYCTKVVLRRLSVLSSWFFSATTKTTAEVFGWVWSTTTYVWSRQKIDTATYRKEEMSVTQYVHVRLLGSFRISRNQSPHWKLVWVFLQRNDNFRVYNEGVHTDTLHWPRRKITVMTCSVNYVHVITFCFVCNQTLTSEANKEIFVGGCRSCWHPEKNCFSHCRLLARLTVKSSEAKIASLSCFAFSGKSFQRWEQARQCHNKTSTGTFVTDC